MRVLDLDLDTFVHNATDRPAGTGCRLDGESFPIWQPDEVRAFLEQSCGLDSAAPVRGRQLETHDEAFYYWRDLIDAGVISAPFDLVHVDAHADFGYPAAWRYVYTELLHRAIPERRDPPREMVQQNNFLLFAFANRWIHDFTFVFPKTWHPDMMTFQYGYMPEGTPARVITMAAYHAAEFDKSTWTHERLNPASVEPDVPFHPIPIEEYKSAGAFDIVTVCRSPEFTPPDADGLLSVIREYIALDT